MWYWRVMKRHIKKEIPTVCFAVLAVLMSFFAFSCAPKTIEPTVSPDQAEKATDTAEAEKDVKVSRPEKKAILFGILLKEADKFIQEGKNREALFVYNRAFKIVDESKKDALEKKVSALLSVTAPETIEAFCQMEDVAVPEPLLMYHLGLNHMKAENYAAAVEVFSAFAEKYPDHGYCSDVTDLLGIARRFQFHRGLTGALLPLSGKYAVFGRRAQRGIELALKDFKADHDQKITVLIKDTGSDDTQARQKAQTLSGKGVSAIIGPLVTAETAGKVAEKNGIPMIAMTQKQLNSAGQNYLFSNFITPEMEARSLVSYAYYKLGVRKFAVLYPDDRYGSRYMNLFWDTVERVGGEIVGVESYKPSQTDFSEAITKLTGAYYPVPDFLKPAADTGKDNGDETGESADEKPDEEKDEEDEIAIDFDAVFIPDSSFKVSLILPQLAFNDVTDVFLLGTKLWHSEALIENAGEYAKNVVITEGFFTESRNRKAEAFTADFTALYGEEPGFIEAVAYDTAAIVFESLADERVASRDDLRRSIAGGRVFSGVTGKTMFDEEGTLHKQLYFLTVKNGEFVEISR